MTRSMGKRSIFGVIATLLFITFLLTWPASAAAAKGGQLVQERVAARAQDRAVAAIATDRNGYSLGEVVTVSGYGFAPYETVNLQVTHPDGNNPSAGVSWQVVSDAAGRFTAGWPLSGGDNNNKYVVTAAGETSNRMGRASFNRVGIIETDRRHYEPGGAALIKGSAFAPGEPVTLQVRYADGGAGQSAA